MLRNYRQIENIVTNSPPQHYYLSEDKHNYSPLPPPTPTDPLIRFKDHEYQNIPGPTTATSTGQSRYEWIFRGSTTEEQVPPPMPPQVVPPPTHFTRGETSPISYKGSSGGSPDYQNLRVSSVCSDDNVDKIKCGDDNVDKIKCVLIGDGAIGKTSLIVSYTTNGYPTEYVPTAFDNYSVIVTIDNKPVRLQLCDTAGQDDFDSLRPLCYPGCDVFIVCFSVVCPTSFVNVKEKWLPELRRHQPDTPVLLVGTQSDLRTDVKVLIELAQDKEEPVSESVASRLAKQTDCVGYVESSALTQRNLKEVFDQALLAALEGRSNARINSHQNIKSKRKNNLNCISDDGIKDGAKRGWRKLCCFV